MPTLFAVFALFHLWLTGWLVRLAVVRRSAAIALAALVAAGLVYDNGMVALGSSIGQSDVLFALNLARFVVHALVTPLLIGFAIGAARDFGIDWARQRAVHAGLWLLTAVLIGYGFAVDLVGLTLAPVREGDVLRYTASGGMSSVPAIVTIVVLLLVGVLLLVHARSGWLALGAAAMFTMAAVPSAPLDVGNLGEVVLLAGLAMTARGMGRRPPASREEGTRRAQGGRGAG